MSNQYDQLFRYECGKSKVAIFLSSCEAVLGLIVLVVTCGLGIGVMGFLLVADEWTRRVPQWPIGLRIGATIAWLVALPFAIASINRFGGTLDQKAEHPLALSFAVNRRPARGFIRRLVYCGWWWCLGSIALVLCEGF